MMAGTHRTSAKQFQEDGLRKKIEYVIQLSNPKSPNPDHLTRFPNECSATNVNRIKDITKRVTHEYSLWLEMKKVRLTKRTGNRRIES